MVNKNSAEYIEELENKIVDLSLKLKGKSNQLKNIENENYERIRKLVHNLKNPIGIAYSFSEMIAESSEKISKEKLEKYTDIIQKSTAFSIEISIIESSVILVWLIIKDSIVEFILLATNNVPSAFG